MSSFTTEQMRVWLTKQVTLAYTHMLLMAEVLGYDTAPMEASSRKKSTKSSASRSATGSSPSSPSATSKAPDKFDGGRFAQNHTVFSEEYGKPLILK